MLLIVCKEEQINCKNYAELCKTEEPSISINVVKSVCDSEGISDCNIISKQVINCSIESFQEEKFPQTDTFKESKEPNICNNNELDSEEFSSEIKNPLPNNYGLIS